MEITNMGLLTNEQQIEFRQWDELFRSPGYQLLIQRAQEELSAIESDILYNVNDERSLYYARGQRSKLLAQIAFEAQMEAFFQGLVGEVEYTTEEQEESLGANA